MSSQKLLDFLRNEVGLSFPHSSSFSTRWLDGNTIVEQKSPIDSSTLGTLKIADDSCYHEVVEASLMAFKKWRSVPAPKRGQLIRDIGDELRAKKKMLAKLITIEVGKILTEGEGEVQEAIDMADFAVGLSRQLYGLTMQSERECHRMYEQWHPLGPVAVITAFNFPMAVWAWNAFIAVVCGDSVIWKPSEKAPLSAIVLNTICVEVAKKHNIEGLFTLLVDQQGEFGKMLAKDSRIPLVSATGSCKMGRSVGQEVAKRMGRCILELGGNNAVIVLNDANLELAARATAFGAVGTAGQRCTTTRRALVQEGVYSAFVDRLKDIYGRVKIGNPLDSSVLMGPLIDERSLQMFQESLKRIREQGGEIIFGGEVVKDAPSTLYVKPTLVRAHKNMPILKEEIFAPILHIIKIKDLDEAIEIHNSVPQGLSSAIFTDSLRSAERFLSVEGSDCGIANVNIGTSGAEIGGAFGGEKETGGGREAGSDAWKQYMRRQTCTINFSDKLPLAQGVKFEV